MRFNIVHKVFFWLLVPVFIIVAFVFYQIDSITDRSNQYLRADLGNTHTLIEQELLLFQESLVQLSKMLAARDDIVDAIRQRETDFLFQQGAELINARLVDQATYIDGQGTVIARGHDEFAFNDSMAQSHEYNFAVKKEIFSGLAFHGDTLCLVAVQPILELDHIFHGALILSKKVVPDIAARLQEKLEVSLFFHHEQIHQQDGFDENGDKNTLFTDRKLSIQSIRAQPVFLRVSKNYSKNIRDIEKVQQNILLVSLAVTSLALLLLFLTIRHLLKPVRILHNWLQKYRKKEVTLNELDDNLISLSNRRNEVGRIAHSALSALQKLESEKNKSIAASAEAMAAKEKAEQANKQLQELKTNLELLVEERTEELKKKAHLLEKEIQVKNTREREISGLKDHLQSIFNSMPSMLVGVDSLGNITYLNDQAKERIKKEDFKPEGAHYSHFLTLLGIELLRIKGSFTNKETMSFQRIEATSSNSARYVDIVTYPYQFNLESGMVIRIDDVTKQVLMENELLKAEKLKSIGVLAGGIAHDFNNLLTGIKGNLDLALNDTTINAEITKRIKRAKKASDNAQSLTRQLLTFSKGGKPVKKITDITDVIKEAVTISIPVAKIASTFDVVENPWPVKADKSQISQVIQNIVINACQAMPDGGEIHVSCLNVNSNEDVRLKGLQGTEFLRITIADNGSGIPEDLMSQIFDPYFTTKNEGNGLGLAICHSIITQHAGRILVEPNEGTGTIFFLYLPAYPGMQLQPSPEPTLPFDEPRTIKILVMDDEETVRTLATDMLHYLGHIVACTNDGKQALELYQKEKKSGKPFNMVLMDLTVKDGMGGEEAASKILEFDPDARIVVCSGYSDNHVIAEYKKYGFCSVLNKPFSVSQLKTIIQHICNNL